MYVAMQVLMSQEKAVPLSAHLSVKRVICDKTKESSVQIFIPHKRTFILVFRHEKLLMGTTHFTWNFGSD